MSKVLKGTKAGRNESRKLSAGLLNTLSAASLLIGSLQPSLAIVTGVRELTNRDVVAGLGFGAIAIILHLTAHAIVRRLED